MKYKKNINVIIGIVIAVIVVGGLMVLNKVNKNEDRDIQPIPAEEAPIVQVTTPKKKSATDSNIPKSTLTISPTMTYTDAIKLYKDVNIQFNPSCQVSPSKQMFKKGTTIMLDNRSDQTKNISFDTFSVTLEPYSFSLTTLSTVGSFGVNCNNAVNVATIVVQE